ncbi:MAG: PucR family transcriptional regulator [Actinobacteria bacterium]|nr:PucR family transcriptional regulator [Actinomycetota bacterium]
MKLSLSMISWYLRDYTPEVSITEDEPCIEGLRLISDKDFVLEDSFVLFGKAEDFFSDPYYRGVFLVAHRHSTMLIRGYQYDELLNRLLSAFDYFNSWESRLLELAGRHASLQEIIETASEAISNPIAAGGFHGPFSTTSLDGFSADPYWQHVVSSGQLHPAINQDVYFNDEGKLILDLSDKPVLVQNVYRGGAPVMMLYIKNGEQNVGVLGILQENELLTSMNGQLAPRLASCLGHAAEFFFPEGSARTSQDIFSDTLRGRTVGDSNTGFLESCLPEGLWRVIVCRHLTRHDRLAIQSIRNSLTQSLGARLITELDECVVAVIADEMYEKLARSEKQKNEFEHHCFAVSMKGSRANDLRVCYEQAVFALECSEGTAGIFRCEDYAFEYLINAFRAQQLSRSMLHPALGILGHYDDEHGSMLLVTLCSYLLNSQNKVQTAQDLHVHVNSLKYRLQRIQELTGIDFDNRFEVRFLLLSTWLFEAR